MADEISDWFSVESLPPPKESSSKSIFFKLRERGKTLILLNYLKSKNNNDKKKETTGKRILKESWKNLEAMVEKSAAISEGFRGAWNRSRWYFGILSL